MKGALGKSSAFLIWHLRSLCIHSFNLCWVNLNGLIAHSHLCHLSSRPQRYLCSRDGCDLGLRSECLMVCIPWYHLCWPFSIRWKLAWLHFGPTTMTGVDNTWPWPLRQPTTSVATTTTTWLTTTAGHPLAPAPPTTMMMTTSLSCPMAAINASPPMPVSMTQWVSPVSNVGGYHHLHSHIRKLVTLWQCIR